jgi:HAD superfamily hydrolase (TIGR01509 family)
MSDEAKVFVFDIGNTLIRLDYETALAGICRLSAVERDRLIELMEWGGGYHDLERGAVSFEEFHEFLRVRAGYQGGVETFRESWCRILAGPVEGIEDLLDRVRQRYRVAFLSNSNEVHAEVMRRRFSILFGRNERIIFSHRHGFLKPDPAMFRLACELLEVEPGEAVLIDDLFENVKAARQFGMTAYQFTGVIELTRALEQDGLLSE